jgi:hypothetical protein
VVDEGLRVGGPPLTLLFPTLRLIGAIHLAFDLRKLVIAAVGLILLQFGWLRLDWLFPASAPNTPDLFETAGPGTTLPLARERTWDLLTQLLEPIRLLATPLFAMLEPSGGWARMLHALLSLLWVIVVWGICGGAIARIAIVQVAKVQQSGVAEALRFSVRSASSLILAPLCPLLGLAFCASVVAAFGLLYRLPAVGFTIAGILLFIPLTLGFLMTLMVAGLVAGWPLMVAAVAGGAENGLDAWSRTFSYLNQRIGAFVALLVLAWLEGIVGLILVDLFAEGMIRLTLWGLGLTAGDAQMAVLFGRSSAAAVVTAAGTHPFWLGVVGILARSWIYSFFWTAAALLYLWLRNDVDGTPWSDCDPPFARVAPTQLTSRN